MHEQGAERAGEGWAGAPGEAEVPWRGWHVLVVVAVALVLAIVVAVAAGLLGVSDVWERPMPLLDTLVLLAATLLWLRSRGRGAFRRAVRLPGPLPPAALSLGLGLAVGVGWPFVDSALAALVESIAGPLPAVQEHFAELFRDPTLRVLLAVDAILVTPIAEELLFRGVLFQGVRRRWGTWAAAIVSSAVFAAAHLEPTALGSAFVMLSTFMFGLAMVWLFLRRRTLLAPIAAHVASNALGTVAFLTS
jgi:membrane protease YdiL (CAAX protease family)